MASNRFRRGYVSIFLSYYKPHLGLFILDMCCALGIALVDLAFPWASREAMNKLLPQSLYAAFFTVMGLLLAAYALRSVMYFVPSFQILGSRKSSVLPPFGRLSPVITGFPLYLL